MPSAFSHRSFDVGRALQNEELVEVDDGGDFERGRRRLKKRVEAMEESAEELFVGVPDREDAHLVPNEDGKDASDLAFLQEAEERVRVIPTYGNRTNSRKEDEAVERLDEGRRRGRLH